MAEWRFLTNHAHVLLCIRDDQDIRMRELAAKVQISERAVKRIVADLGRTGYLSRQLRRLEADGLIARITALQDHLGLMKDADVAAQQAGW